MQGLPVGLKYTKTTDLAAWGAQVSEATTKKGRQLFWEKSAVSVARHQCKILSTRLKPPLRQDSKNRSEEKWNIQLQIKWNSRE